MKASVFIGTSLDGFIARTNGDLDFLPPGGGEPHGYDEFMATVDALVIGRKTFETVLTFDTWPYGGKPVFVLSTRPLAPAPFEAVVERMSGDPPLFLKESKNGMQAQSVPLEKHLLGAGDSFSDFLNGEDASALQKIEDLLVLFKRNWLSVRIQKEM